MRTFLLVLFLVVGGAVPAHAQDSSATTSGSSTGADADWIVVPFFSYSPTTKLALGGGAGYYTSAPPGESPSQIEMSVKVTQRGQISAEIAPELYLNEGRLHIQGELRGSKYPSSFYGIGGDTHESDEESYTSRFGLVDLLVQQCVHPNLHIGPRLFVRVSDITDPDVGGLIAESEVMGARGSTTAGIGGTLLWNARDNDYYPTTGTYAAVASTWHSAAWGSDHTYGHLKTDLRGYRPLGPGVLAGQVFGAGVLGDASFLLLPTLGGDDLMRGYRFGRFRDSVLWTVQTEYRVPVLWRVKGAAFASAGEVAPRISSTLFDGIELAAGVGGRFRLTDSGLHARLDVAYSRTGVEVYVSVGEAF